MCSEGESRVASLIAAYQVGVLSCLATKHNKLNSNSRTHSHSAECSILAGHFFARWWPDKIIQIEEKKSKPQIIQFITTVFALRRPASSW